LVQLFTLLNDFYYYAIVIYEENWYKYM